VANSLITVSFCSVFLAFIAGCSLEPAADANAKLNLSLVSTEAAFSQAISNVENGYSDIGDMDLHEIVAVASLDQETRRIDDLVRDSDLYPSQKQPLTGRISLIMFRNDVQKSKELLALKPVGRWFDGNELNPAQHQSAWLIVQHGSPEIQVKVLPELVIAAKNGLLKSSDVAMLADRVEVAAGRPQIYGTQLSCIGEQAIFPDLIDPVNVDKRREEAGLSGTFIEYKARLLGTNPC
jgi:hypothetical protein